MTIGERIRMVRKHRKLSQEELGELAGLHQTRISKWERNEEYLYADQAKALADALGVTADYLLDPESLKPPTEGEFQFLKEAKRIGFDAAWRTLLKYGEPAKRIGSLGDTSGED